jgi:hypothetical protein
MAPVGLAGSSFHPALAQKKQLYAEDLPRWVNGQDPPLVHGLFRNPFLASFRVKLGSLLKKVRHLPYVCSFQNGACPNYLFRSLGSWEHLGIGILTPRGSNHMVGLGPVDAGVDGKK